MNDRDDSNEGSQHNFMAMQPVKIHVGLKEHSDPGVKALLFINGVKIKLAITFHWLVGCFGFNGPLRQYFSLYLSISQREIDRGEK